jgi:hypothetical protein
VLGPSERLKALIDNGLIADLIDTGKEISDAMGAVTAGSLVRVRDQVRSSNGRARVGREAGARLA